MPGFLNVDNEDALYIFIDPVRAHLSTEANIVKAYLIIMLNRFIKTDWCIYRMANLMFEIHFTCTVTHSEDHLLIGIKT